MNQIVTWITSNGISIASLEMIVYIPILATVVNFARYFVGLKSFGIYAPIILAIAYRYTGLRYGLILTVLVAVSTIIGYSVMKRFRMHYIARVAINYIIIIVLMVLGIKLLSSLPIGFENFKNINPLALVSIAAISDFFIKMYVKKDIVTTGRTLLETIIISSIGWYLISLTSITSLILNNLWVILVIILVNFLIGIYPGLRVKEIFRFWYAVKNDSKDTK